MTEPLRIGNYQKLEPLSRQLTHESYQKLEPLRRTSQNAERAKTAFENEINAEFSSLMEKENAEPIKCTKSEMTFWSRYDAVANHQGNTDHWTKLKQRAVHVKSLDNPDAIGQPITLDALQGNMPGTYMYTRPRNSPARDSLQNSFHDRAKEGFRYWLIDRPKPTSFGKYGIGSYKTVLGVGNAPRT